MIDFNQDLNKMYQQVKAEFEREPFLEVAYPQCLVTEDDWDYYVDESILPLNTGGSLFAVFDEFHTMLYLGKSKTMYHALKNHLIRKTSPTTSSILDRLKELILDSDDKIIYIKILDIQPPECAGVFKSLFAREHQPLWVRRVN